MTRLQIAILSILGLIACAVFATLGTGFIFSFIPSPSVNVPTPSSNLPTDFHTCITVVGRWGQYLNKKTCDFTVTIPTEKYNEDTVFRSCLDAGGHEGVIDDFANLRSWNSCTLTFTQDDTVGTQKWLSAMSKEKYPKEYEDCVSAGGQLMQETIDDQTLHWCIH